MQKLNHCTVRNCFLKIKVTKVYQIKIRENHSTARNYLQKKKTNTHKCKIWALIQKILYGGIRLPILGKLTYDTITTVADRRPIYTVLPVYLMGLFWTANLLKQRH